MAPGVMGRIFSRGLLLALMLLLGACAETAYYWQSIGGHMRLMQSARPIRDWLDDVQTAPALRARLQLAQQMRRFASSQLHLPDNASYQAYADLQRRLCGVECGGGPRVFADLEDLVCPGGGLCGVSRLF
jgi:predicted aminopeptidase